MKTNGSTFASLALLATLMLPAAPAAQASVVGDVHALEMSFDQESLQIRGGNAGDPCGLLLGLERGYAILPGGAELDIKPLLVLVLGDFDRNGEFQVSTSSLAGRAPESLTFFAQAIAVERDSGAFQTSNDMEFSIVVNLTAGGRSVRVVQHDENGNPVEAKDTDTDGGYGLSEEEHDRRQQDEYGNPIETKDTDTDGGYGLSEEEHDRRQQDEYGNPIEAKDTDTDGGHGLSQEEYERRQDERDDRTDDRRDTRPTDDNTRPVYN